jgi:hypothetical protein
VIEQPGDRQGGAYWMPACAGMTTHVVIPAEQAQRARAGIQ